MNLSFPAFLAATLATTAQAAGKSPFNFHLDAAAKTDAGAGVRNPNFSAVYAMTNQEMNEVLVYSRDTSDGSLTFEGAVPTAGSGFGQTTAPVDPLAAQDPMVVAGRCLLAVNAGSDTVSSFRINGSRSIKLAGVYPTGGTVPVSVAENNGVVYVLNSGGNGSIQGYSLEKGNSCIMKTIGDTIELDQGPSGVAPTDPADGLATPTEVGFTPDGDILVVIKVRGGGMNIPDPGEATLNHYAISVNGTTTVDDLTKTTISDRNSSLPFAFDFDDDGRLLLAEVFDGGFNAVGEGGSTGGVSVWNLEDNGTFSQDSFVNVEQHLTCWIRFNPGNGCAYTSNAGAEGSVSSLSAKGGSYELVQSVAAGLNGPIDLVVSNDGKNLYVLSPGVNPSPFGSGISQIYAYSAADDCGLTQVQAISDGFDPSFIAGNGAVGLAVFPGNP